MLLCWLPFLKNTFTSVFSLIFYKTSVKYTEKFKVICFTYWGEDSFQDLGLDRKSLGEEKPLEQEV